MAKEKFDYSESSYNKRTNLNLICFNGKSNGDERVLSNYYPFDFNVGGVEFHSVEQYYHWKRFEGHPKEQAKILTYTGEDNAHLSRHYAHIRTNKGKLIMDEEKRIDIMRDGLQYKLKYCKEFRDYLLSTGSKDLVEFAPWGDDFWGTINSVDEYGNKLLEGQNILGKLLMELRTEAKETPILTPVEPPTVEVAPTIQPKQDEEQKHIYADSLLDRIKGDFIVRYRIEDRVEEDRVDSYGEACDLYQQAQDIMTTSTNPCWLALFNGDDIIEIELYD